MTGILDDETDVVLFGEFGGPDYMNRFGYVDGVLNILSNVAW